MKPGPRRWRLHWTLQRQLLLLSLVTTVLAWAGGIALALAAINTTLEQLHDRELVEVSTLLHGLSGHELQEVAGTASIKARIFAARADTVEVLKMGYRYEIWSKDGEPLLSNYGESSRTPLARLDTSGHSWVTMEGEQWRVYAHYVPELGQSVQVAERASLRVIPIDFGDRSFLALALASLLLAVAPAVWLSRRLMRPLGQLVRELAARSPEHLEPLRIDNAGDDLGPVVTAMNRLFRRVETTLRHEHEFTGLAAHELRTPMATVCLLARSAGETDIGQAERTQLLDELVRSADRCAHLLDQLLTLSRLDRQQPSELQQEVELTEVVMQVLAEAMREARPRRVKLASRLDGSAITGHPFGVATLVRNLVANAVRYTPEGGRVEVATVARDGTAWLTVDDSGPGIPAADRARVFERFVRLQPDRASGVGLGLSIVREVAAMHGGLVTLSGSPLGGLRVTVEFRGRAVERAPFEESELPT